MSKKQYYIVSGKTSEGLYKIINKVDLSVILLTLEELTSFKKIKNNSVELDQYMNNIYDDDPIYQIFVNIKK